MTNTFDLIQQLEKRIAELPVGYISKKIINGKERYYHQWKEDGKLKSKYIKKNELEHMEKDIEERKRLQSKLKELKDTLPKNSIDSTSFETNVKVGLELNSMVVKVKKYRKRDIFPKLSKYLYGDDYSRVCVVYGLRRTGKTTMLFQAIADMDEESFSKTAYIKLRVYDEVENIKRDLDKLYSQGYRYIFMDEITLMKDFIDSAALFSDIYVPMGMKIVLSGTDSLGFWIAQDNELYDRARMLHTTYIPYREYSRLLGIDSIDDYIRYGGTLTIGETNFDDEDIFSEDASFRDDESTRRYIDTAICKNIQRSLAYCQQGHYLSHLYDLYEAGELTGAINRVIEDMNHRFVVDTFTRRFVSNDLGISARNLRNERDEEKRTDILYQIDIQALTEGLMKILEIKNKENQDIKITNSHISLIKSYLKALDLIFDCPIEHGELDVETEEHILIAQPGMRYSQAQALIHMLMKDDLYKLLPSNEKEFISERILQEVRGRMLEDIILLETSKSLDKRFEVFKLQFISGEFDMVIRNKETNTCALYEIKHSDKYVIEQAKHLLNPEKISLTTPRFGDLVGRYVLYLGENIDTSEGIAYRNAKEFLKNLPQITLESGLE